VTSKFRSWEDYYIPGSKVLRNLLPGPPGVGETDAGILESTELALTFTRVVELAGNPVVGVFDLPHLQEIHRRIFCDVYPWAGRLRVGPATRMTKMGPNVVDYAPGDPNAPMVAYGYFPATGAMADYATTQLALLPGIAGIDDADELLTQAAEVWSELNVAHPFREGNTRTQIVFFTQYFASIGFTLDAPELSPQGARRDEFIAARFHAQATGGSTRLAQLLGHVVHRGTPTPQRLIQLHQRIVPPTPPGM
jgi:cell filamentation protein